MDLRNNGSSLRYVRGVDEQAPEYIFPGNKEHAWLRPPLLVGEVNYSMGVCKRFQARICAYAKCRYLHICAVCGAEGHGAWICGGRRQRMSMQCVIRCYIPGKCWVSPEYVAR
eukprot:6142853-Alexandrium_andersonii.AAC.1